MLLFLAIWIFYTFREFRFNKDMPRFMEGLTLFVTLDVFIYIHMCIQLKRSPSAQTSRLGRLRKLSSKLLSFVIYSVFIGFPIGTTTKSLVILWQFGYVNAWVILLPYLVLLGTTGIVLPSVTFYVIIRRYQTGESVSIRWLVNLCVFICAAVGTWAWFYGFVMLVSFISESNQPEATCWTLRLLPVMFIPVVASFAICLYPLYKGTGQ